MRVAILATDGREMLRQYDGPQPIFGTAPQALLQGFAALPDVEVHVLSCVQRPVITAPKLAPNIWFHALHVPKFGWMRTGYQGCIRAFRRKLRELRPDIVHGQGTERDCAIGAVFSGFPNVITVHGNMRLISKVNRARPFSYQWLAARIETLTIPRSAGTVCITRYTEAAVSDLAKKTWVVPNAVDESFFCVSPAPAKPPVILCVGSVSFRKNYNSFIRALDALAAKEQFTVEFLGEINPGDAYGAEFLQLVEQRPWCVYGGFADRAKVKEHLSKATLLALPSLEDNCPMVVLEAMAVGVPVMASKVGGVPDLIQDEVNGLFCSPDEPESFRQVVARFLASPELRRKIAITAREQATRRFHPKTIAERHREIYREVLSTPS